MKQTESRSFFGYVGLYVIGLIVGAANVIPGVSGGTMAFILGIYEELLNAIKSFTSIRNWKPALTGKFAQAARTMPWTFMVVLLLGVLSASVLLAKPIKWMLEHELAFILAFFFGLVAASVITVLMRVSKFRFSLVLWLALGAAAGWLVVGLTAVQSPPDTWWYMMLCGAVAICAMILPGISGSFILMLMGRYKDILGAIENLTRRADVGAGGVYRRRGGRAGEFRTAAVVDLQALSGFHDCDFGGVHVGVAAQDLAVEGRRRVGK